MKKGIALLLALVLALACMSVGVAEDTGLVDGRFAETRSITVEIFDRSNDGGSDPTNNKFTQFIKDKMLEKYNVEVTFVSVPRWTEVEVLNNLLAAGTAPDICLTYSYPTITTYAGMGGVLDLKDLVDNNKALISNMINVIGEDCLYYDLDRNTNNLWAIEARRYGEVGQDTFVREDWLAKLGLAAPTTIEEFGDMLRAFRDNAETLLGADAAQMIPMMVTQDAGWYIIEIAKNFIPNDVTDEEWYVYGYDDRGLLREGYKDAVRVINGWYNEGLLWKDFAVYGDGDNTHDNLTKAGYVGAFIQNSDMPYRNGNDGYQVNMQKLQSPDAAYIPVATFKNDAGVYKKYFGVPVDRKIFFPATNDEPIASLLYLDFISSPEALMYLQAGDVGVNHEVTEDGLIKNLPAVGADITNSLYNIDYTMTCNGLNLGDLELAQKSLALGYAGIDPKYILASVDLTPFDVRYFGSFSCGNIAAEEGMETVLKEKRNNLLAKAITCPVAEFDATFDAGMADYLSSGGQAIIDERAAAWDATYGDSTSLPQ